MARNAIKSHERSHLKRVSRYLIVALLPLVLCWFLFTRQSHQWAEKISEANARSILTKSSELINQRFSGLEQSIYALANDPNLNQILASADYHDSYQYTQDVKELTSIIGQYFWNFDNVTSFHIVSSVFSDVYFNTTGMPNIIHPENIVELDAIRKNRKSAVWFPQKKLYDVINLSSNYKKHFSNLDVISVGMMLDLSYFYQRVYHQSPVKDDYPVLLITLNTAIFDQWLENDSLLSNISYRIYTENRDPVYLTTGLNWEDIAPELLPVYAETDRQLHHTMIRKDGKTISIESTVLEKTGWIISSYSTINDSYFLFQDSINVITMLLMFVSILLVFLVTRVSTRSISEPLSLLCDGLNETACGNYDYRINENKYVTYHSTFEAYNSMNEHIDRLIKENYKVRLNEKEMEIQMLNMQFNPHFRYNMLNTISLTALEAGQDQISDMLSALSFMMRYSVKTNLPFVMLREELQYVTSFISAMQMRTNSSFSFENRICEELFSCKIPRFLLQPFVENAIIHGFIGTDPHIGYRLVLDAERRKSDLIFRVIDNGIGLEQEVMDSLWSKDNTGIGIVNTHKRLQMYYGKDYGVELSTDPNKGTAVTICIPYETF